MGQFEPSLIATDAAERARFLAALRSTGSVSAAARMTGTIRSTAYAFRKRDPAFAAAWDDIKGQDRRIAAVEALEAAAIARATFGVARSRRDADGRTETWREFDNRLTIDLLKLLKRAPAAAAAPVRSMTRAEFIAAIDARPRTADLPPG